MRSKAEQKKNKNKNKIELDFEMTEEMKKQEQSINFGVVATPYSVSARSTSMHNGQNGHI